MKIDSPPTYSRKYLRCGEYSFKKASPVACWKFVISGSVAFVPQVLVGRIEQISRYTILRIWNSAPRNDTTMLEVTQRVCLTLVKNVQYSSSTLYFRVQAPNIRAVTGEKNMYLVEPLRWAKKCPTDPPLRFSAVSIKISTFHENIDFSVLWCQIELVFGMRALWWTVYRSIKIYFCEHQPTSKNRTFKKVPNSRLLILKKSNFKFRGNPNWKSNLDARHGTCRPVT